MSHQKVAEPKNKNVIWAAGFCIQQSSKTRGIGFCDEQSPTIVGGAIHGVVLVLVDKEQDYELSESHRAIDGEQSSG